VVCIVWGIDSKLQTALMRFFNSRHVNIVFILKSNLDD